MPALLNKGQFLIVLPDLRGPSLSEISSMTTEIHDEIWNTFRIFLYLSVNPNIKLACSITRDADSFNFIIGVQETTQDLKKVSALT